MEQTPIFIPLDEIADYPDPMAMPDNAGRLALKAKGDTLHGYRCKDITSEYMWNPNGTGYTMPDPGTPDGAIEHIGSVVARDGFYVWHFYRKFNQSKKRLAV